MIILYVILSALTVFFAVILIKAALFVPKPYEEFISEKVDFDREASVKALCELVKCRTVSNFDGACEDEREFLKFKNAIRELFPSVFAACEYEEPSARSVLIRWRGRSSGSPVVLMAHYDVVDVNEEGWKHPPFDGVIEDGCLWGRGTLDTKCTLSGILFAAETLINTGFTPENDIYFSFAGNEEIGGNGTPSIVSLFKERGIVPAFVLDEGGAVVSNVFPGVKKRSALIGIAEKGMLNVRYTVKSAGGHSSAPLSVSPIGKLSRACVKTEGKPFKFRLTEPAKKMFDTLARHSSFGYRIIFANLWCFAPVLNLLTKIKGGELSAIVRTTTAFTVAEGSRGMNVIPESAKLISNHRIITGETANTVIEGIRKRVSDPDVHIEAVYKMDPSRVSPTEGEGWSRIERVTRECFGDVIVSPYLMLACSDSRHFGEISDRVYRFSPMELTKEERALIHASDERIPLKSIEKIVEFYIRLIGYC